MTKKNFLPLTSVPQKPDAGKDPGQMQSPIPGMTMENYSANLRKTTQAVKDQNLEEIGYCKHNIEQLEREDLDKLELPILIHNFILLAPQHRFEILDDIEKLMRELIRAAGLENKIFSKERRAAVKVLEDIRDVKKQDTAMEYAQFDISQFLTAYYHFMFCGKYQDNHEQRKLLKHIRDYMTEKLKVVLKEKEKTVSACDEILSKKLAGE